MTPALAASPSRSLLVRLTPYAALLLAYAFIQPWGDFPLNDDWVYARIAHRFADTGQLRVEGCHAAVIGQILLAVPFVKLFGHSHVVLRSLTMVAGLATIWAIGALLRVAAVRPRLVLATQLLFALNPLFLYCATTFMTELYGQLPALIGIVLFYRSRRDAETRSPEGAVIAPAAAALAGVVVGASFWVRQLCILAFPALLIATVATLIARRDWSRLRRSAPALAVGSAAFAAVVLLYFPVARATGNLTGAFQASMQGTNPKWDVASLVAQGISTTVGTLVFLTYMTAFFVPMLALGRWQRRDSRALAVLSVVGISLVVVGIQGLHGHGAPASAVGATVHRHFPFGGNVLLNTGVGPLTLADVYLFQLSRPGWPAWVWRTIEAVIVAGTAAWSPLAIGAWRAAERGTRLQVEMLVFAFVLVAVSVFVPLYVFKYDVFDRYYLPAMIGMALFVGLTLSLDEVAPRSTWNVMGYAGALAAIGWFGVAGLHDQFSWNEARWALVGDARARGVSHRNLEAGYEVNGWLAGEPAARQTSAESCIGPCHCYVPDWSCQDASYRVGMNSLAGYEVLRSRKPSYWLASGPPLILERRQPSTALFSWRAPSHGASTRPPPGVALSGTYRLLTHAAAGTRPVYECRSGGIAPGSKCADGLPPTIAGHLYAASGGGAAPLFTCRSAGGGTFVSRNASCEGQEPLGLLGWTPP